MSCKSCKKMRLLSTMSENQENSEKIEVIEMRNDGTLWDAGKYANHPLVLHETKDLDLFDANNAISLYNLAPLSVRARLPELPGAMYNVQEDRLKQLMKDAGRKPTLLESRLRVSFWREFDKAVLTGLPMTLSQVSGGICMPSVAEGVVGDDLSLGWILCPPISYGALVEEALSYGLGKMREILDLDEMDDKGRIMTGLVRLKFDIVRMLDERVKGKAMENINIKTAKVGLKEDKLPSYDEIDRRIVELKEKLGEK